MKITECPSCGARVVWTRTVSGKRMMIDADPVSIEDGGIEILDPESDVPQSAVIGFVTRQAREVQGVPLYRTHFATCTNWTKKARA